MDSFTLQLRHCIESCSLFKGCELRRIESVLLRYNLVPRTEPAGKTILLSGEPCEKLIVVLSGSLTAEMRHMNGKVIKIETLSAGNPVAAAILFSSNPEYPVCLVTDSETALVSIPKRAVLDLFKADETFLINYLRDMGDKVQFLAEKIRLFGFSSLRAKIAGYLLSLRNKAHSNQVTLSFSKETLSEIMGVARPSLSREFANMIKEGLFEADGKDITLIDIDRLKEEISEPG